MIAGKLKFIGPTTLLIGAIAFVVLGIVLAIIGIATGNNVLLIVGIIVIGGSALLGLDAYSDVRSQRA